MAVAAQDLPAGTFQDPDDMPTLDELRLWARELEGEFESLNTEAEAEASVYYQRFEVEEADDFPGFKSGSAPSDADAAIDSLTPDRDGILIRCKPARAREKYRRLAQKKESFGRAWLRLQRERKDPLRLMAADMAIRRRCVARVLTDLSGWPTLPSRFEHAPQRREDEDEDDYRLRREAWHDELDDWELANRRTCPIKLEWRDCRNVRWRELSGLLLVVVDEYETTVLEAYQGFSGPAVERGVRRALRGKELNEKVRVRDVWFKRWRCIFMEDEPILVSRPGVGADRRGIMEHGYPGIPYVIAAFRELPADDPADRYRGLLTNAAQLYQIESSVLVMQVQMLRWNAWRTWTYWTQDESKKLEMVPGVGLRVNRTLGEYIEIPQGASVPPEVLSTVSVVDAYIQRNGVAQGPRTAEGTRSASQLWAIQSQRSQKIKPGQDGLVALLEQALEMASYQAEDLLRTFGGTLTLPVPGRDQDGNDMGEVTLKASDIAGYYRGWQVSFGKRLDPALIEQAKSLFTFANNQNMPRRTSIELSSMTDNPQEWLDQMLEEKIESLPFMLEAAGLKKLAQWYGEDSEEYQMFKAKVLASKTPAPGQPGQMQPTAMKGPPQPGSSVGDAIAQAGRVGKPRGGSGRSRSGPPATRSL